jgi:hypothetical protein
MWEYIVMGLLAGSLPSVVLYWAYRKLSNPQIMSQFAAEILENALKDTETQQGIFQFGALLGSSITKGSGLVKGGKFKLEDVIAEGAMMFIRSKLPQLGGVQTEAEQANSLNRKTPEM